MEHVRVCDCVVGSNTLENDLCSECSDYSIIKRSRRFRISEPKKFLCRERCKWPDRWHRRHTAAFVGIITNELY